MISERKETQELGPMIIMTFCWKAFVKLWSKERGAEPNHLAETKRQTEARVSTEAGNGRAEFRGVNCAEKEFQKFPSYLHESLLNTKVGIHKRTLHKAG